MTPLSRKTIHHFTHCHPLTEFSANGEFLCSGCSTLGSGTWYRCELCNFDLHDHCATCPMELSSFMHEHRLQLVVSKPQAGRQNDRVCDLCCEPVEGLFYRCNLCEFDAHPLCTQLPEYVRHVMHKDHPLRLQRSEPGRCMVCKNTCTSWHYRCGICSFDLHFECVLAPCPEPTTTSTSRSLPPSAPPFFDARYGYGYGYGYGATPHPPSFAYGYGGVPYAHVYGAPSNVIPPHFTPYAHVYGAPSNVIPPHFAPYAHVYGAPSNVIPPHFTPYAHVYGAPSNVIPPHFTPYAHVNGAPYNDSNHHSSSSQVQGSGQKVRKKMYAIIGKLALGVLSSVVFGAMFL